MKKPKITYAKRYNKEGIGIDRYENGIGIGNPIVIIPDKYEDMADRIVFSDQIIDALIDAYESITYRIENKGLDPSEDYTVNKIKEALTKVGVEICE